MRLHGSGLEDTLKEVWLPVVPNSHCAKMYGMIHNVPVKSYHLCAGSISEGGIGTCIVSLKERSHHETKQLALAL